MLVIAVGSGLYIGAGLGTGPRDGIMVGLATRGYSVRVVRTVLEALVLVIGFALVATSVSARSPSCSASAHWCTS